MNRKKYLGHDDWRVPTKEELDLLRQNKDRGGLKDTFKTSLGGNHMARWYHSSTPTRFDDGGTWIQRFDDGKQYGEAPPNTISSVRLVRG